MPRLTPVGRAPDIASEDLDPVEMPIIGYDIQTKEEVEFLAVFPPTQPSQASIHLFEQMTPDGGLASPAIIAFLREALIDEEMQSAWDDFLARKDIAILRGTLIAAYESLTSYYAGRPTVQRSDSSTGGSTTASRSRAAANSKASNRSKAEASS